MKKLLLALMLLMTLSFNSQAALEITGVNVEGTYTTDSLTLTYKVANLFPPGDHTKLMYEIPHYPNSKIDVDFDEQKKETSLNFTIARSDLELDASNINSQWEQPV